MEMLKSERRLPSLPMPCFSDERNRGSGKRTKVTVKVKSLSGCSKPQKSYCIPFVLCL